ncbi:MAG TPA: hypothetical protein PLB32_16820 [Acidobacteriota bacterium]|nr:hypothetical protein [Acidobacteriota bacterium]
MSMPVSNNPSSAPGNFASPGMIPPPPDSTTATVSLVSSPAPLAWNPPAPVQQSGLPSSSFGVPTVSANPMTPAMGANRSVPNQMAGNYFDNSPLPSFNPPPPAPTVISGLVLPPPDFD